MTGPVEFEWDLQKAEANFAKHGVTFLAATEIFMDPDRVELDTTRSRDGEPRFKVVGRLVQRTLTVVCTMRGPVCRLISARRANRSEERMYDAGPLQARSE